LDLDWHFFLFADLYAVGHLSLGLELHLFEVSSQLFQHLRRRFKVLPELGILPDAAFSHGGRIPLSGFAVEQVDSEIVGGEQLHVADNVFFGPAEFVRPAFLLLHSLLLYSVKNLNPDNVLQSETSLVGETKTESFVACFTQIHFLYFFDRYKLVITGAIASEM